MISTRISTFSINIFENWFSLEKIMYKYSYATISVRAFKSVDFKLWSCKKPEYNSQVSESSAIEYFLSERWSLEIGNEQEGFLYSTK